MPHRQLAAVTNGADDTYYYYFPENPEIIAWSLQCILSGGSGTVTVTIEGSNDPDATIAGAGNWEDVTATVNAGTATITASKSVAFSDIWSMRLIRVKVVASTGGQDDADWELNAGWRINS